MAENRMDEVAGMVAKIYLLFPIESHAKTEDLLVKRDRHGLFIHLEDLIASRAIDDVLQFHDDFRDLMRQIYADRHPWLNYSDLGLDHEGEEQDRGKAWARKEVENMGPDRIKAAMKQFDRMASQVQRYRKRHGLLSAPVPSPASRLNKVPLAPSAGGKPLRQPFTTGWTFRPAPPNVTPSFDPKDTCRDFVFGHDKKKGRKPALGKGPIAMVSGTSTTRLKGFETADNLPPKKLQHLERSWNPSELTMLDVILTSEWLSPKDGKPTEIQVNMTTSAVYHQLQALMSAIDLNPSRLQMAHVRKMMGKLKMRADERMEELQQIRKIPPPTKVVGTPATQATHAKALLEDYHIYQSIVRLDTRADNPSAFKSNVVNVAHASSSSTPPAAGASSHGPAATSVEDESEMEWVEPTRIRPDPYRPADPMAYKDDLLEFLENNDAATEEDYHMMEYRGWRIHAPKIQLIRIKNFLADEDIDRTLGWNQKFSEITLYLAHLMSVYKDQHWGRDLKEAILMLHAHWLYEQHHYGEQKPNFDFSETPTFLTRLKDPGAAAPMSIIIDEGPSTDDRVVKPRYLNHRPTESVYDVDYQVPYSILYEYLYKWYREDDTRIWYEDNHLDPKPEFIGSGERGVEYTRFGYSPDFNMSHVAEERFMRCINMGPAETARTLRCESNFYLSETDSWISLASGDAEIPNGTAARRFADFRGAKRAALQHCINHFTNEENVKLMNPFRRLVLPPHFRERERREKNEAKQIIFKPKALEKIPTGEKLDPLGFLYWHDQLLKNHTERSWQTWHRAMSGLDVVTADGSKNFMGPVVPTFLSSEEETAVALAKKLRQIHNALELAYRRAPRPLLKTILDFWKAGKENVSFKDPGFEKEIARWLKAEEEKKSGRLYPPITERYFRWMRHVAGPSVNDAMLDEKKKFVPSTRRMEVFAERVQDFLDNRWVEGVLTDFTREWTVDTFQKKLNIANTRDGSKSDMFVYTAQEVEIYSELLSKSGLLVYRVDYETGPMISRPELTYHPELRIDWSKLTREKDGSHHDLVPLHTTPPLSWEEAVAFEKGEKGSREEDEKAGAWNSYEQCKLSFKSIAWRMGHAETEALEQAETAYTQLDECVTELEEAEWQLDSGIEQLDEDLALLAKKMVARNGFELGSYRKQLFDRQAHWIRDVFPVEETQSNPAAEEQGTAAAAAAQPRNAPVSNGAVKFAAVARAAQPAKYSGNTNLPRGQRPLKRKAVSLVRKGMIKELSEAGNMLWPARREHCETEKDEVITLRRDRIWSWAEPGRRANYEPKQYFSINRWPLHLQSDSKQADIQDEARSRPVLPTDILRPAGTSKVPERQKNTSDQDPQQRILSHFGLTRRVKMAKPFKVRRREVDEDDWVTSEMPLASELPGMGPPDCQLTEEMREELARRHKKAHNIITPILKKEFEAKEEAKEAKESSKSPEKASKKRKSRQKLVAYNKGVGGKEPVPDDTGYYIADTPLKKKALEEAAISILRNALNAPEPAETKSWFSWLPFYGSKEPPQAPHHPSSINTDSIPLPPAWPGNIPRSIPKALIRPVPSKKPEVAYGPRKANQKTAGKRVTFDVPSLTGEKVSKGVQAVMNQWRRDWSEKVKKGKKKKKKKKKKPPSSGKPKRNKKPHAKSSTQTSAAKAAAAVVEATSSGEDVAMLIVG